jgi:hypothetical protein
VVQATLPLADTSSHVVAIGSRITRSGAKAGLKPREGQRPARRQNRGSARYEPLAPAPYRERELPVGPSARPYREYVDNPVVWVAAEQDSPLPHSQTPQVLLALQLAHVAAGQPVDSVREPAPVGAG